MTNSFDTFRRTAVSLFAALAVSALMISAAIPVVPVA